MNFIKQVLAVTLSFTIILSGPGLTVLAAGPDGSEAAGPTAFGAAYSESTAFDTDPSEDPTASSYPDTAQTSDSEIYPAESENLPETVTAESENLPETVTAESENLSETVTAESENLPETVMAESEDPYASAPDEQVNQTEESPAEPGNTSIGGAEENLLQERMSAEEPEEPSEEETLFETFEDPDVSDSAAKIGDVSYTTFADAAEARTSNDEVITLLQNIADAYVMRADETLKVEKNGKKITVNAPEGAYLVSYSTSDGITTYTVSEAAVEFTSTSGTVSYKKNVDYTNVSASGTYKLLKDITAESRITNGIFASDVTIDLNGFTLTSTAPDYAILLGRNGTEASPKKFTIIDSSESGGGTLKVNPNADAAIQAQGKYNEITFGEKVTIDGGCIAILSENQKLDVYGTVKGGDDFAIATNGSTTKNAEINIHESAVVESDTIAVYLPGTGTTTIAGTVTGSTAVYQKSGTLNITGGTLAANGNAAEYTYNGNGANATGDALVVDSCGYPGGAPVVNISAGTFTSENAKGIGSYTGNSVEELASVNALSSEITTLSDEMWLENAEGGYDLVKAVVVTFDHNDGKETKEEQKVEPGKAAVKPDDPTRVGYTFSGWYAGGAEEPFDFETVINENTVLTAHWVQDTLTIPATKSGVAGNTASIGTIKINGTTATSDQKENITWKSSDESVVMVDASGTLTYAAPGTVTVTAVYGDSSAICEVTVDEAAVKYTSASGAVTYSKSFTTTTIGKNGTYQLLRDASVTLRIAPGIGASDATLDLNGFTLTSTAPDYAILLGRNGTEASPKKFTIIDSSESGGGTLKVNPNADAAIQAQGKYNEITIGEKVTIDGGCIAMLSENQRLDVYGTVKGGDDFAVATNGSTTKNTEITIHEGASVESDATAVYLPGNEGLKATVEGTVTGGKTGIEIRAGELTVKDGAVVKSTYEGKPSSTANGSGSTTVGAAIAIAQHTTKLPVKVTIEGGEIEGPAAVYESNPQENDEASAETVSAVISGGVLTGEVTSTSSKIDIKGGIFEQNAEEDVNQVAFPSGMDLELIEEGRYAGMYELRATLKAFTVEAEDRDYEPGLQGVKPVFTAKTGDAEIAEADYTLNYKDESGAALESAPEDAGKYTVTAVGAAGSIYEGSVSEEFTFEIFRKDISGAQLGEVEEQNYTGSGISPALTVTLDGSYGTLDPAKDYTPGYSENTAVGTASYWAEGTGNYTGKTEVKTFKITGTSVSKATVKLYEDEAKTKEVTDETFVYDGTAKEPVLVLTMISNGKEVTLREEDYTATFYNNVNAGSGAIFITGEGSMSGGKIAEFKINPAKTTPPQGTDLDYTGAEQNGVTAPDGAPYTLSGTVSAKDPGTYKAVASLSGANYSWEDGTTEPKEILWKIVSKAGDYDGPQWTWSADYSEATATFTGKTDQTNKIILTADITAKETNEGTDYVAAVTFEGIEYKDTQSVYSKAAVSVGTIAAQTFTGSAVKPAVTVTANGKTLKEGEDYTVSYANNVNAGSATAIVACKGRYAGSYIQNFTIEPKEISKTAVTLAAESYIYDTTAKTPAVTVKDGSRTLGSGDYTVTYKDNSKSGTATAVITGKGNYKGTVSKTFKIVSEQPVSGQTYVIRSAANNAYAMDVAKGSRMADANIDVYKVNGTEAQAYTFIAQSDGTFRLLNYKGMSVGVSGASREEGANASAENWKGKTSQKFTVRVNDDGSLTFINKNSGKVLDIAGGKAGNKKNVMQSADKGTASQKWVLINATSQVTPKTFEGTFTISSAVNKKYVMDVKSGSKKNKANVWLYKNNGTNAQVFTLTYRGDGFYSITNKNSGKVLDAAGGKAANGTNVQQYKWNGTMAQLWRIAENSDGTLTFHSAVNESFVLDLKGAKARNKRNIQLYKGNGTKAQKWILKKK